MNIYQPFYAYIFVVLSFVINIGQMDNCNLSIHNLLINDPLTNNHIKLFCYLLLNCAKSLYMKKQITKIDKQLNQIYDQNSYLEQNNNILELYVLNIPQLILSMYISVEIFFIFYAFNETINKLHIITFILINVIKFYNVYEFCIYWNYVKQLSRKI